MSWPVKKCEDDSNIKASYQEKIGFNLEKKRFAKVPIESLVDSNLTQRIVFFVCTKCLRA